MPILNFFHILNRTQHARSNKKFGLFFSSVKFLSCACFQQPEKDSVKFERQHQLIFKRCWVSSSLAWFSSLSSSIKVPHYIRNDSKQSKNAIILLSLIFIEVAYEENKKAKMQKETLEVKFREVVLVRQVSYL